jgi:hypothetical protein
MEHPNFVYRDLNKPPSGSFEEIEVVILPDNKLHIQVNSLHENQNGFEHNLQGPDGPCSQADLVVKYHDNLDLFTTITTILDKLTDDHRYYLGKNRKFTDKIHCFPEFVKDNPDLPYIEYGDLQSSDKFAGWASLEFTPENMKYVGVSNRDYEDDEKLITLYGEVNEDGLFTYDYPLISRGMDQEYYDITRGHNVLRITFNPGSYKYVIDPEFSKRNIYYQEK